VRRNLHRFLWIALILTSVWWTVREPYQPDRLQDGIPFDVDMLTVHDDLADRHEAILQNPLVRSILSATGKKEKDFKIRIPRLMNGIGSKRVLFGHLAGQKAWSESGFVMSSFVGSHMHRLRLLASILDEYQVIDRTRGHTYYEYVDDKKADSDTHISAALAEGILIATAGPHPSGVRQQLDCLDSMRPSINDHQGLGNPVASLSAYRGDAKDAGLYMPSLIGAPAEIRFKINRIDQAIIHAEAEAHWPRVHASYTELAPSAERFAGLFGEAPLAMAVGGHEALGRFMDLIPGAPKIPILEILREGSEFKSAGLAVLANEYAGSYLSIQVPSICLAFNLHQAESIDALVAYVVRDLSKELGANLMPQQVRTPHGMITVLDDTQRKKGMFDYKERVCYAVVNQCLVVCSNENCLTRLLARQTSTESLTDSSNPAWFQLFKAQPQTTLFAWADGAQLGSILKDRLSKAELSIRTKNMLSRKSKAKYAKLEKNLKRAAIISGGAAEVGTFLFREYLAEAGLVQIDLHVGEDGQ